MGCATSVILRVVPIDALAPINREDKIPPEFWAGEAGELAHVAKALHMVKSEWTVLDDHFDKMWTSFNKKGLSKYKKKKSKRRRSASAGPGNVKSKALTVRQYMAFCGVEWTAFTLRTFAIMDFDATGTLDFEEWVIGVWNMCTFEEKALEVFTYSLYDLERRGHIELEELTDMLHEIYAVGDGKQGRKKKASFDEVLRRAKEFCITIELDGLRAGAPKIKKRILEPQGFLKLCKSMPSFLMPAFRMQRQLRDTFGGQDYWAKQTKRRISRFKAKALLEREMESIGLSSAGLLSPTSDPWIAKVTTQILFDMGDGKKQKQSSIVLYALHIGEDINGLTNKKIQLSAAQQATMQAQLDREEARDRSKDDGAVESKDPDKLVSPTARRRKSSATINLQTLIGGDKETADAHAKAVAAAEEQRRRSRSGAAPLAGATAAARRASKAGLQGAVVRRRSAPTAAHDHLPGAEAADDDEADEDDEEDEEGGEDGGAAAGAGKPKAKAAVSARARRKFGTGIVARAPGTGLRGAPKKIRLKAKTPSEADASGSETDGPKTPARKVGRPRSASDAGTPGAVKPRRLSNASDTGPRGADSGRRRSRSTTKTARHNQTDAGLTLEQMMFHGVAAQQKLTGKQMDQGPKATRSKLAPKTAAKPKRRRSAS